MTGNELALLPLEEALCVKWQAGREKYGPEFVGDPVEELFEELLDAINYTDEAVRQGIDMGQFRKGLIEIARSLQRGIQINAKVEQQKRKVEAESREA